MKMEQKSNFNHKKKQNLNLWSKVKRVLKQNEIKGKEKLLYKQSIGFDIIDKNK